jgi:hypothetical protein
MRCQRVGAYRTGSEDFRGVIRFHLHRNDPLGSFALLHPPRKSRLMSCSESDLARLPAGKYSGRFRHNVRSLDHRKDLRTWPSLSARLASQCFCGNRWCRAGGTAASFSGTMIVAAGEQSGAELLLTGDLSAGERIAGIEIVSPFSET